METTSVDELRSTLRACLPVQRWIDEIVAQAPFAYSEELLNAARDAAPLTDNEVAEGMVGHARIGETPTGSSRSESFSRREQQSADASDADLAEAIAEGNREYEARFDRVFMIRAAGRSRAEILSELRRRLQLDDETELRIVAGELREIALLRLVNLVEEGVL